MRNDTRSSIRCARTAENISVPLRTKAPRPKAAPRMVRFESYDEKLVTHVAGWCGVAYSDIETRAGIMYRVDWWGDPAKFRFRLRRTRHALILASIWGGGWSSNNAPATVSDWWSRFGDFLQWRCYDSASWEFFGFGPLADLSLKPLAERYGCPRLPYCLDDPLTFMLWLDFLQHPARKSAWKTFIRKHGPCSILEP